MFKKLKRLAYLKFARKLNNAPTVPVPSIISENTKLTGDIISNQVAAAGVTTIPVYGSATTGQQTGDRTVSAAGVETYCARLQLPIATGNAAASLSSDLTFTFDAEQTANT